jgi:purine nucleosidase
MTTPAPRPLYFDCDTGIDDALALAYLIASPEIDLVGVGTVSGNIDAERAAVNTLDLLVLGRRGDIAVAVGAHDPQVGTYHASVAHIHGKNGIGDIELPPSGVDPVPERAAQMLVRLAHEHAGELEVVAVGPLTNLAAALRLDPDITTLVHNVTIMGGAALVPGNVTPSAEANIWNDPEAAAEVFAAPWPITLVPLDVTLENSLREAERQQLLDSPNPLNNALGRALDLYFDFYVSVYGERSCALHDPLAAALAVGVIHATNAPAVQAVVDDTQGPGRGQTICDLRGQRQGPVDQPGAHLRVVLDTDQPLGPHLMERLLSYAP